MRITSCFVAGLAIISGSLFSTISQAQTTYKSHCPPIDNSSEINGSAGGDTARSFIAAGMMGAKFYGNGVCNVSVAGMESTLLQSCQAKTNAYYPGSTWPEQCNFDSFVSVLNTNLGQGWVSGVYPEIDQVGAINSQVQGLVVFKSPSIAPIYGHADHWATIFEIRVDATGTAVQYMKYFDGGSAAFLDGSFDQYLDGMTTASGNTWKNVYFKVITTVAPTDPYYGKYITSYDPPPSATGEQLARYQQAIQSMSMDLAPFPGVISAKEEMSATLAEERVWSAIFLSEVDQDPIIQRALERGMAGAAREVHGRKPSGEPWDYFLVPILINDREVSAMVQLSGDDGALEQLWIPSTPMPFLGLDLQEAAERAERTLLDDEVLVGGELTWDPALNDPHCRSPLVPYYEFHVVGQDSEYRGGVLVSLDDGVVRGLKQSIRASETRTVKIKGR